MTYQAPVDDILAALLSDPAMAEVLDEDIARTVLTEAGKMASALVAPTNAAGDREGARLTDAGVVTASGFREAYAAIRDGGWLGLPFPEAYGGQNLPRTLALAVMEILHSANTSLALCPMLSLGAIEALLAHGDEAQKRLYLPRLISGEWTGTMNLTEPQAGSDVGALVTRATPNADGSFAISGQKIYITWGDHDLTENIVHLVLARLPDAPEGSRGVSLFLCPKFLPDAAGGPGARNGVACIGLESKIGIHGSPTCVMEYAGATAWLVGEPNKGMAAMFTMMNAARVNVGIQGVAIAESAFQTALAYAKERVQGRAPGANAPSPILHHPGVFRKLLGIRARVMAARALCLATGAAADRAASAVSAETRDAARRREDLLTPIAKAWSTDIGVESASAGVQVHGGMGFMNETAAAQLYRDARIGPIYEGTNGIQAIDLVSRKLAGDNGFAMRELVAEMTATARRVQGSTDARLAECGMRLMSGIAALSTATDWMLEALTRDRREALSSANSYLSLSGVVIGAHALVASAERTVRMGGGVLTPVTAQFFCEDVLAPATSDIAWITRAGRAAVSAQEAFLREER